jgi:hypothetical protein
MGPDKSANELKSRQMSLGESKKIVANAVTGVLGSGKQRSRI